MGFHLRWSEATDARVCRLRRQRCPPPPTWKHVNQMRSLFRTLKPCALYSQPIAASRASLRLLTACSGGGRAQRMGWSASASTATATPTPTRCGVLLCSQSQGDWRRAALSRGCRMAANGSSQGKDGFWRLPRQWKMTSDAGGQAKSRGAAAGAGCPGRHHLRSCPSSSHPLFVSAVHFPLFERT